MTTDEKQIEQESYNELLRKENINDYDDKKNTINEYKVIKENAITPKTLNDIIKK